MELIARGIPAWPALFPLGAIACGVIYLVLASELWIFLLGMCLLLSLIPIIIFFRDPERKIGEGVVSPADGRVVKVEDRGRGWYFVSIFMNVHNVHVNRSPWDGIVISQEHIRGGFVPAFNKDSDQNERLITVLRTSNGNWEIKQIAGAVARRIISYVKPGQELCKGERFGMIRFGSRVDITFKMPRKMSICVKEGDRIKAGITNIAGYERASEKARGR